MSEKIIAYQILLDTDEVAFINKVNKSIENGWQPFGGVSADSAEPYYFLQAMVMYESQK